MPTAYGYARVSHRNSHNKGDSIPAQKERIEAYYKVHLQPDGVKFAGCKDDNAPVSAYKVPFHARPTGQELLKILKPGDHLIIDKVDRLFRSMRDYANTIDHLGKLDVTVHIVSFLGQSIRHDKGAGKFMLSMLVACAELESDLKSERICQAKAYKRAQGQRESVPFGTKLIRKKGEPDRLIWDWPMRSLIQRAVQRMYTAPSLSQIFQEFEPEIAKLEGRKQRTRQGVYNNFNKYNRMIMSEYVYQEQGYTDANDIPQNAELSRLIELAEVRTPIAPHKRAGRPKTKKAQGN